MTTIKPLRNPGQDDCQQSIDGGDDECGVTARYDVDGIPMCKPHAEAAAAA